MIDRRASSLDKVPPRVAVIPSDQGAGAFYRVIQPLRLLERQGKITIKGLNADGTFALGPRMEFDVLILQKTKFTDDEAGRGLFADVQRNSARVVYELDDALFDLPRENPSFGKDSRAQLERQRQMMRACRLVTTTTDYAAALMRHVHPEVRVVPNGIDLDLWNFDRPDNGDTLRIAWAASPHHVEDARLLIGPMRELFRLYPHIRLVLAGGRFPELMRALPEARYEYAGSVNSMREWPAFAASLRADIWLAPLVDSRFARSKSNLKFLEGAALGLPVVASDVQPYRVGPDGELWFTPPLGLVRSTREWMLALSFLIENEDHRREMGARARKELEENWTAQHSADAWMRVIEEVAGA